MAYFIWVSLFFILGIGYREVVALLFSGTVVLALLIWDVLKDKKLFYPKLFFGYVAFLASFLANIWWSKNQLITTQHWLIFASMSFVWIYVSSHANWFKKYFLPLLLTLGMLFFIMTIASQTIPLFSFVKTTPRGLVGMYSINADHFMLGDFWAVLLIVLVYRYLQSKKGWLLPFICLGMAILLFALSRSALVGFIVALAVYFSRSPGISIHWKRFFWVFVAITTLYMATQKSLLFNRPYYIQALAGFFAYPFGVGVGNFELISKDTQFHLLGLSGFSRVTHSLFLEFIAGMGVLGLYFWWWCYRVYMLYIKPVKLSEYSLALIALVVDFMFNPTYFVSPMWWMLGMLLPLSGVHLYEEKVGQAHLLTIVLGVLFLIAGFVSIIT